MLETLDRQRRVSLRDEAMPALLVEAAELRVPPLQLIERCQGLRDVLQITPADRDDVKRVTVAWRALIECLGYGERLCKVTLLEQCPGPLGLSFDIGRGGLAGCIHERWGDLGRTQ